MTALILIGVGAALMYVFDPDSGRRRQALLRDKLTRLVKKSSETAHTTAADPRHPTPEQPVAEATTSGSAVELPTDDVLVSRVRLEIERLVADPNAIQVTAHQGRVRLTGTVAAHEEGPLLERVSTLGGVLEVDNRLGVRPTAHEASSAPGKTNNTASG